MKILIVNLHSSKNAGDDLLTSVTIRQMKESFPYSEIILSMNDPASYCSSDIAVVGSFITWFRNQEDNLTWIHIILFMGVLIESLAFALLYRLVGTSALKMVPKKHKSLLGSYFSADLVVSAAGNFLYTSGRIGLPFIIAIYTMAYAWLTKKPLYTMPQTIGPLNRKWERSLVKWITNKARIVFVRDTLSSDVLKDIGVPPKQYRVVPDLAFAYPRSSPKLGRELLEEYGVFPHLHSPLLGITMMNWGAQTSTFTNQVMYETAVANAISTFISCYQGKAILFSQVLGPTYIEDDRVSAKRVLAQMQNYATSITMIDRDVTTEELKSAYSFMDIFIGTRLHSNIFAVCEEVPALMIEYRYKTRGVMQMLNLNSWVMDIHTIQLDDVSKKLQELWIRRQQVKQHIHTALPSIIQQASQVGQIIANDYNHIK